MVGILNRYYCSIPIKIYFLNTQLILKFDFCRQGIFLGINIIADFIKYILIVKKSFEYKDKYIFL